MPYVVTRAARIDMKIEALVIPVSDVDRAKRFYTNLGWRIDADFPADFPLDNGFRVVQFMTPGSGCSVQFGTKIHQPYGASGRLSGPAPDHVSYRSFATFSDPDGSTWLLQEVTTRLPGRIDSETPTLKVTRAISNVSE